MKDDHKARGNGVCSLLLLVSVSCIPAAADYTASIQTQGPSPTWKNELFLLHVARLKDMPSLKNLSYSVIHTIHRTESDIINVVNMSADLSTKLIIKPVQYVVVNIAVYLKCWSDYVQNTPVFS